MLEIREWAVRRRVYVHVNAYVFVCVWLRGVTTSHGHCRAADHGTNHSCSSLQDGGLGEELPYVTLRGHREEASLPFTTPTAQAAADLAFSRRSRKVCKTVPSPLSPRTRLLSTACSAGAGRMEPCCTTPDVPSFLGPWCPTVKPSQLLLCAVLPLHYNPYR